MDLSAQQARQRGRDAFNMLRIIEAKLDLDAQDKRIADARLKSQLKRLGVLKKAYDDINEMEFDRQLADLDHNPTDVMPSVSMPTDRGNTLDYNVSKFEIIEYPSNIPKKMNVGSTVKRTLLEDKEPRYHKLVVFPGFKTPEKMQESKRIREGMIEARRRIKEDEIFERERDRDR
jgi:hypothetical protein